MSNILLKKGSFVFKTIYPEIEDQAIRLISHTFANYEPLCIHLKTSSKTIGSYFYEVLNAKNSRELSIVCIHEDTQELCGVSINNSADALIKIPDSIKSLVEPMYQLFGDVSKEFLENNKNILKFGCHIEAFGVPEKWAGYKIGYNLAYLTYANAKKLGYSFVYSENTGLASQRISVDKLGCFVAKSIKYKDYLFNGKKTFQFLEGDCKLCLKIF